MHRKALRFIALLGLCVSGTGCPDRLPAARSDKIQDHPQIIPTEHLDRGLLFGDAVVIPSSDEMPMHVEQPLRSTVNYALEIQYRFEFYSSNNRLLTRGEEWRYLHLEPKTLKRVMATAADGNAADWRLVLRPAR